MTKLEIYQQILQQLVPAANLSPNQFSKNLRNLAGNFGIAPPKKADLLSVYHKMVQNGSILANNQLESILVKREIRTVSGVAPIAVLTKPFFCPGRCAFCPTEAKMPKSYLSNEPAVMRAILNKWDPYDQVQTRLRALQQNGHSTDKCELIVIGGTWSFLPKRYQTWYIKRLFDSLNGYTAKNLAEAQKFNETAPNRAVGLCLETRPDYINTDEIARMRKLGCTRVEIGLQSTDPKVLKLNKRGHGVETVKRATTLLRDAGFKISYHVMPDLPGATPESDIKAFQEMFTDPGLQPDMLKIYPCMVVKDAEIYQWWKEGKYQPYDDKTLFNTLVEIKKLIPPYCRITRLIRDIPTTSVYAGTMTANLRQQIQLELKKQGRPCPCIRCREPKNDVVDPNQVEFVRREYQAGEGNEIFLSLENKDRSKIFGFCRLRLPKNTNKKLLSKIPELKEAALIRELHVYGILTPIDAEGESVQHKGFGKRLMAEAEKIAAESGYKKLTVISGIGVREYYKKIGYNLDGTYMSKKLV